MTVDFIKLTDTDGDPIYVRASAITAIAMRECRSDLSTITVDGEIINVEETQDEILVLLTRAPVIPVNAWPTIPRPSFGHPAQNMAPVYPTE